MLGLIREAMKPMKKPKLKGSACPQDDEDSQVSKENKSLISVKQLILFAFCAEKFVFILNA